MIIQRNGVVFNMLFVYRVTRVRVGVGARAYVNKVVEWETKK